MAITLGISFSTHPSPCSCKQCTEELVFLTDRFGLGVLCLSLVFLFYNKCRQLTHPIFAGLATLVVLASPEFFAYTFILQTDMANAIFMFVAVIYTNEYIRDNSSSSFWIGTIAMFFACWSRTETLIFVPIGALLIVLSDFFQIKNRLLRSSIMRAGIYCGVPFLTYLLWNQIFLKFYLPQLRDLSSEIVLGNGPFLGNLFKSFAEMKTWVIAQPTYWSYLVPLFLIFLVVNVLGFFYFKNSKGFWLLIWLFLMLILFGVILTISPAATAQNTFRRGFFKFVPLMSMFIFTGSTMAWLGSRISRWEMN